MIPWDSTTTTIEVFYINALPYQVCLYHYQWYA